MSVQISRIPAADLKGAVSVPAPAEGEWVQVRAVRPSQPEILTPWQVHSLQRQAARLFAREFSSVCFWSQDWPAVPWVLIGFLEPTPIQGGHISRR